MTIRVAIIDDHRSIIDGYLYRLSRYADIDVVATAGYGEQLEPLLQAHPTDVLLLDVNVPVSADNRSPYPVLHVIPKMLQTYPDLAVLVISMYAERAIIRAVMEAGASGYIIKDDAASIEELGPIIHAVASGGIHLSKLAHEKLLKRRPSESEPPFTWRQLEVLSLCAAYPDHSTAQIASRLGVANSTVRNLLSTAYLRLGVHNRAGAIARARKLGLITPYEAASVPPG